MTPAKIETVEQRAIRLAIEATNGVPEPYRSLSFPVFLERNLRAGDGGAVPSPGGPGPSLPSRPFRAEGGFPGSSSFVEIYSRFAPTNNYERVIVALYHLHKHSHIEPASVAQINAKLWEAKVKVGGIAQFLAELSGPKRALVTTVPLSGAKNGYHLLKGGYDLVDGRLSRSDAEKD